MMTFARSFRGRFLFVVALVAIMPLVVVGVWVTRTAERSAENLLRGRLDEALGRAAAVVTERWIRHRAHLLDVAEQPALRQALARPPAERPPAPPPDVLSAIERTGAPFSAVHVRDSTGRAAWTFDASDAGRRFPAPALPLSAAVYSSPLGGAIGSIATTLPVATLVADRGSSPGSVGAIVGMFDAQSGAPLVPLPFERPDAIAQPFEWAGDRWVAATRTLSEPSVLLVAAAPLAPFEQPLRDAARGGLTILGVVGVAGLLIAAVLASRMAGSLERLAAASEAVAAGDFDGRVDDRGANEVGRMARAFNRMTASLRTTLQALADQRALARVGEFAASLAHEIRNPLTAIRVDLQVVQESLPETARTRRPLDRALAEIERLDRTVGSALLATRAARTDRSPVDLLEPLDAAIETAEKSAPRALTITLEADRSRPTLVSGDTAALQQLFLNLLLNAVEAARDRGSVHVAVDRGAREVTVHVIDTGAGLTEDEARRAFDPLFTTREGGSGLGLTIAARLARAHDGSITLAGAPGHGATATVTLPLTAVPL